MRKFIKATSLALALTLFLGACSNKGGSETGDGKGQDKGGKTEESSGNTDEQKDDDVAWFADPKEYTMNDYIQASPLSWNPHTWQTNADSYLFEYLTTSLVSIVPDGEGGFKREYEAAESIKDITADFADKEKWGIEADAKEGLVFEINLRKGITWEDGTEINADSHVYSMKQLLNPAMKNYRAPGYVSGTMAIRGAEEYAGQEVTEDKPDLDFSTVGFFKGDNDYQLIYVLEQPLTEFVFLNHMSAYWLVHEGLYEKGKKQVEGLTATDYGTTVETTSSWGPYKLISFEKDRQIKLVRNEKWFGYNEELGIFNKSYQTDNINIEIIEDPNTALQLFNQGKLDNVNLEATDFEKYRLSDYLYSADTSLTLRFVFATNPESLEKIEANAGDGSNKRILQYPEFRKAISLAIDREKMANETTPGYRPAYFLLNNIYYYDIENNQDSVYRKSEPAMAAIADLYGIKYGEGEQFATVEEAYNAITGFDSEQAKELFQEAYDKAVADGNYDEGQNVVINVMIGSTSTITAEQTRRQDMINESLKNATEGTDLAGKVSVKFKSGEPKRYEDLVAGKYEAIMGGWQGSAFYPFSTIGVYTNPEAVGGINNIHESNGWDPTKETLTIKADFNEDGTEEEETKTFTEWQIAISYGDLLDKTELQLKVLAALEAGVLGSYQCIPLFTGTYNMLKSQKYDFFTEEYHIMYNWGGFRLYEYKYDDAEWEAYIKEQGGILNYE